MNAKADRASSTWELALAVAEHPATEDWQQLLADSIERAVRPDAVGIFLCRLGYALQATSAVAPRKYSALGEQLIGEFLPRIRRERLEPQWEADGRDHDVKRRLELEAEVFAPSGFIRVFGVSMRSSDGVVAGWITIFSRSSLPADRAEILHALKPVACAAESAIQRSIDIARAVGATFPKISPYPLSERELQIARLAASGFSNLNIARALGITEGTVGRHLHNIYRKLGVGSRLELTDLRDPHA